MTQENSTIRDQFAMAALTGLLAGWPQSSPNPAPTDAATWSYQYADAMLAARETK